MKHTMEPMGRVYIGVSFLQTPGCGGFRVCRALGLGSSVECRIQGLMG